MIKRSFFLLKAEKKPKSLTPIVIIILKNKKIVNTNF